MKVETKLSIGEKAWFMYENKAISKKILSIQIGVGVDFTKIEEDVDEGQEDSYDMNSPLEISVKYYLSFWVRNWKTLEEEQVSVWGQNAFKTKEELLNSL